jgi:hypothetical protein
MVLDIETPTRVEAGQRAQYGAWIDARPRYESCRAHFDRHGRLHQDFLDGVWREGVFYEPECCTEADIETLNEFHRIANTYPGELEKEAEVESYRVRSLLDPAEVSDGNEVLAIDQAKTMAVSQGLSKPSR